MSDRHELEPLVHDWLEATLETIPEPTHRFATIASEVNRTPQEPGRLERVLRRGTDPGAPAIAGRTATTLELAKPGVGSLIAFAAVSALVVGLVGSGVVNPPWGEKASTSVTDPAAATPVLPTVTVAPGIERLDSAAVGLHPDRLDHQVEIAIGPEGAVWVSGWRGGIRRLGTDQSIETPGTLDLHELVVRGDGAIVAGGRGGLAIHDGATWTTEAGDVRVLEVLPDGTPWVSRITGLVNGLGLEETELGRAVVSNDSGGPGIGLLAQRDRPGDIAVDAEGNVWAGHFVVGERDASGGPGHHPTGWLARTIDGEWRLEQPLGDTPFGLGALAAGADGSMWALLMIDRDTSDGQRPCCQPVLARFDRDGWTSWTRDDGLPLSESYVWSAVGGVATLGLPGTPMVVAPDGTVWIGDLARGVVSFDGTAFSEYATGPAGEFGVGHATEIALAPDGAVWAAIGQEVGNSYETSIYRIDPETAGGRQTPSVEGRDGLPDDSQQAFSTEITHIDQQLETETMKKQIAAATFAAALLATPASAATTKDEFTGTFSYGPLVSESGRGEVFLQTDVEFSDRRLQGTVHLSADTELMDEGLYANSFRIETDEGAWQGDVEYGFFKGLGQGSPATTVHILTGEGEYEGLTAIAEVTLRGGDWSLDGYIIDGELPDAL